MVFVESPIDVLPVNPIGFLIAVAIFFALTTEEVVFALPEGRSTFFVQAVKRITAITVIAVEVVFFITMILIV